MLWLPHTHSLAYAPNHIIALLHLLLFALPSVLPISALLETGPTITTNVGLHVDITSTLRCRMVLILPYVFASSLSIDVPSYITPFLHPQPHTTFPFSCLPSHSPAVTIGRSRHHRCLYPSIHLNAISRSQSRTTRRRCSLHRSRALSNFWSTIARAP
jgi:hypothetical protein